MLISHLILLDRDRLVAFAPKDPPKALPQTRDQALLRLRLNRRFLKRVSSTHQSPLLKDLHL